DRAGRREPACGGGHHHELPRHGDRTENPVLLHRDRGECRGRGVPVQRSKRDYEIARRGLFEGGTARRSSRLPPWSRRDTRTSDGTTSSTAATTTTTSHVSVTGAPAAPEIVSDSGSRYGYCATPEPQPMPATAAAPSRRVACRAFLRRRRSAARPQM